MGMLVTVEGVSAELSDRYLDSMVVLVDQHGPMPFILVDDRDDTRRVEVPAWRVQELVEKHRSNQQEGRCR